MKKFLKNLLLLNVRGSDFEIISQECSMGDAFHKIFSRNFDPSINMFLEWGHFALYAQEEILKNLL